MGYIIDCHPQNMPLWCKDYRELKTAETMEKVSAHSIKCLLAVQFPQFKELSSPKNCRAEDAQSDHTTQHQTPRDTAAMPFIPTGQESRVLCPVMRVDGVGGHHGKQEATETSLHKQSFPG